MSELDATVSGTHNRKFGFEDVLIIVMFLSVIVIAYLH